MGAGEQRIVLVAGESSGDQLAADLMLALKRKRPDLHFEGIAGPRMQAAGCDAWYAADKLAVMGLVEVVAHLREILAIRRDITRRILTNPPALFIGIDAPDFNLPLEAKLKQNGITTCHYVSPSVWAWRQNRVKKIAHSVDRMLTLFPFETDFYRAHGVKASYVGHPFADQIPLDRDDQHIQELRQKLGLGAQMPVLALLPGSRRSEIERLGSEFLQAARRCQQQIPDLHCLLPLANDAHRGLIEQLQQRVDGPARLQIITGQAREVLSVANVALLASGTVALEALLVKCPMVVAYKLSPITYAILRLFRMLKVKHYSLPNWLAGEEIVPECMQGQANADRLAEEAIRLLQHPDHVRQLRQRFRQIHEGLRAGGSERAAAAVLESLPS